MTEKQQKKSFYRQLSESPRVALMELVRNRFLYCSRLRLQSEPTQKLVEETSFPGIETTFRFG